MDQPPPGEGLRSPSVRLFTVVIATVVDQSRIGPASSNGLPNGHPHILRNLDRHMPGGVDIGHFQSVTVDAVGFQNLGKLEIYRGFDHQGFEF